MREKWLNLHFSYWSEVEQQILLKNYLTQLVFINAFLNAGRCSDRGIAVNEINLTFPHSQSNSTFLVMTLTIRVKFILC